jgi:hypothetical protein
MEYAIYSFNVFEKHISKTMETGEAWVACEQYYMGHGRN